jgi:hypothetical protein
LSERIQCIRFSGVTGRSKDLGVGLLGKLLHKGEAETAVGAGDWSSVSVRLNEQESVKGKRGGTDRKGRRGKVGEKKGGVWTGTYLGRW